MGTKKKPVMMSRSELKAARIIAEQVKMARAYGRNVDHIRAHLFSAFMVFFKDEPGFDWRQFEQACKDAEGG